MKIIFLVFIATASVFSFLLPTIEQGEVTFSRPTLIAVPCEQEPKWHVGVYEDEDYRFVFRHYGKAEYVPGFFAYSKKRERWLEIKKLSTENAKLGHSPPMNEVMLSVSWDHRHLKSEDYVELPLRTSGSIMFPTEIENVSSRDAYHLNFNPTLKPVYQTRFLILKKDLEKSLAGLVSPD